jgi:hypothetical protein
VVRAAGTDPHVPQHFAAGGVDLFAEVTVLLLAERESIQMRSPDKSSDDDSAPGGLTEHRRDIGIRAGKSLIWIASPVREQQQIARRHRSDAAQQLRKIAGAMNQRIDLIAGRP